MPKYSKTTYDIPDLDKMLKRLGAANPEVANLLYPKTFEIMMHPFTAMISANLPEYEQLLADMSAKELVRKLSYMDADQKLIDLGLAASGKEASGDEE